MFYFETIGSDTLQLLRDLQKIPFFSELRLVGGTSLALQIGHRKSIDIDLFGNIMADYLAIIKDLNKLGTVTQLKRTENINIFIINNIKVDIVNYHYQWIEDKIENGGIILAGKRDIAAMKLAAITGRGTKKDFIDLYFLLQEYNLKEMLEFYSQKFIDGSVFLVLKSLLYFNDAETEEHPVMLKPIDWAKIKEFIKLNVENYLKTGNQ